MSLHCLLDMSEKYFLREDGKTICGEDGVPVLFDKKDDAFRFYIRGEYEGQMELCRVTGFSIDSATVEKF